MEVYDSTPEEEYEVEEIEELDDEEFEFETPAFVPDWEAFQNQLPQEI